MVLTPRTSERDLMCKEALGRHKQLRHCHAGLGGPSSKYPGPVKTEDWGDVSTRGPHKLPEAGGGEEGPPLGLQGSMAELLTPSSQDLSTTRRDQLLWFQDICSAGLPHDSTSKLAR